MGSLWFLKKMTMSLGSYLKMFKVDLIKYGNMGENIVLISPE